MGAKQSKRSVDISGKEAENAGEVAAAGAGGEGRMEALADADALKPQLNGDAHIHEQSDKEKQLDSGTPENEKDATTEKESKDQEDDKEAKEAPVANGENGEQKENGDSTPAPEDGKKPKKEKVKKKWSLRSISFSRKEKPKQEKKPKEEEPKSNGEPEKVPEEAAETTLETPKSDAVEEVKPETESKDEKTPETPVTEPITNGSTTPESKVETPAAEEPAVAIPETNRPEAKAEPEPEQLPVNGLSLEEAKNQPTEVPQSEERKPEEPTAETTESASAPEIPVKKEVCVEQMPLIEPTPPPLPANPPPSSVASFAATTMAPELTDASLANTTESAILSPPSALLETKADQPNENVCNLEETKPPSVTTVEDEANPLPPPFKEVNDEKLDEVVKTELNIKKIDYNPIANNDEILTDLSPTLNEASDDKDLADSVKPETNVNNVETTTANITSIKPEGELPPSLNKISDEITIEVVKTEPDTRDIEPVAAPPAEVESNDDLQREELLEDIKSEAASLPAIKAEDVTEENSEICISPPTEPEIPENSDALDSVEDLPPPPPVDDDLPAPTDLVKSLESTVKENFDKVEVISNHVSEITSETHGAVKNINGNDEKEDIAIENHTKDLLGNVVEPSECNGNGLSSEGDGPAAGADGDADAHSPQEPIPVSDKLADLIPEVPVVPELKTETETTSDVAVVN